MANSLYDSQGAVQDDSKDPRLQALQSMQNTGAFLKGGAQGATFNFGDEASAALGAVAPTETDSALNRGYGDRYQLIRDQLRSENKQSQSGSPGFYSAGELTGGALPAALPFGGALKAASIPAKVAGTAATIGAYSGLQGAGSSEDPTMSGRIQAGGQAISDTAKYPIQAGQQIASQMGSDPSGALKSSSQLALFLLPFALEGKPINDFVLKRYGQDVSKLSQQLSTAAESGDREAQLAISKHIDALRQDATDTVKKLKDELHANKNIYEYGPLSDEFDSVRNAVDPVYSLKHDSNYTTPNKEKFMDAADTINQRGLNRDKTLEDLGYGKGLYTDEDPKSKLNDQAYEMFTEDPSLTPQDAVLRLSTDS